MLYNISAESALLTHQKTLAA